MQQQAIVNGVTKIFLSGNIRALRKRMGISQEELATRSGLNRGNIASYENGTAEPKICSLFNISNVFGVSIIDLVIHDLSEDNAFQLASTTFQQRSARDKAVLDSFHSTAEELKAVMDGLHTCYQFKLKSIDDENAPKEISALANKFEELHEVAQKVLEHHEALIDFVQCRLKHKSNC